MRWCSLASLIYSSSSCSIEDISTTKCAFVCLSQCTHLIQNGSSLYIQMVLQNCSSLYYRTAAHCINIWMVAHHITELQLTVLTFKCYYRTAVHCINIRMVLQNCSSFYFRTAANFFTELQLIVLTFKCYYRIAANCITELHLILHSDCNTELQLIVIQNCSSLYYRTAANCITELQLIVLQNCSSLYYRTAAHCINIQML